MDKFVIYCRVSTARQNHSGLGLEAQEAMVRRFLDGAEPVAWYSEAESGGDDSRPELAKAIAHVKRIKGVLLCAKLDRLSRSVSFILSLADAGIPVRFADAPSIRLDGNAADRFVVTVLAGAAELERNLASERTKAALAAKRARGGVLGNASSLKPHTETRTRRAVEYAERLRPLVESMDRSMSQRAMVRALASAGVRAPNGGAFQPAHLQRVLARLDAVPAAA